MHTVKDFNIGDTVFVKPLGFFHVIKDISEPGKHNAETLLWFAEDLAVKASECIPNIVITEELKKIFKEVQYHRDFIKGNLL